ncbi:MAG: nucleoside monophosphate kinase [Terriglobales bacterium]
MNVGNPIGNLATANKFTSKVSQKEKASPAPNDRCGWFQPSALRRANATAVNASAWRLVLLGAPGVGKGTQADLLNRRLEACHLSTGDLFRAASKQKDVEPSPAMRVALDYMRRGDLVPDGTVWEMVRERTECLRCSAGFVLDGFPRTLCQAESLRQLMESERIPLNAVVNYELPLADIVARLSGRRTCEKCKAVFHVTGNPPKVDGVCDRCQGSLFQREDDRTESIAVRMETYERSTAPLIEFYRGMGLLVTVAAVGSPDEICARTMQALGARPGTTAGLRD